MTYPRLLLENAMTVGTKALELELFLRTE